MGMETWIPLELTIPGLLWPGWWCGDRSSRQSGGQTWPVNCGSSE